MNWRSDQVNLKKANTKIPISTRILTSSVSRDDTAMKPMPETIACTRSTAPRLLIRPAMMNSVVVMNRLSLRITVCNTTVSAIRFSRSSTRRIQRSRYSCSTLASSRVPQRRWSAYQA